MSEALHHANPAIPTGTPLPKQPWNWLSPFSLRSTNLPPSPATLDSESGSNEHGSHHPHLADAEQEASTITAAWQSEQAAQNTSLTALNAQLWVRRTADQTRIDQLEIQNADLQGRKQGLEIENAEMRGQMERESEVAEGLRGRGGGGGGGRVEEQKNEIEMLRKQVRELRERVKGLEGTAKKRARGGDEGRLGVGAKRKKTGILDGPGGPREFESL